MRWPAALACIIDGIPGLLSGEVDLDEHELIALAGHLDKCRARVLGLAAAAARESDESFLGYARTHLDAPEIADGQ